MSKKVLKVDQSFDKLLSEHVTKNGRMTFCITIRGTQAVLSGEKKCVDLASTNLENITLLQIVDAMKEMDEEGGDKDFKSTEKVDFPPLDVKFKGELWTLQKASRQLSSYLNFLGFGKTGTKKFTEPNDEPDGWPQEHSYETFVPPTGW